MKNSYTSPHLALAELIQKSTELYTSYGWLDVHFSGYRILLPTSTRHHVAYGYTSDPPPICRKILSHSSTGFDTKEDGISL